MSIRIISQFLSSIPLLRHRDTVNPNIQADKDDFVIKYEATNDHLANTTVTEINTMVEEINNTAEDINLVADEVEANAMIAQSIGNYQGVWNSTTAYLKNQSVSIGNLFYTAKVNNTNIFPSDTEYWLSNPINNKLNTNISTYDEKTTPINADLIPLCDSTDAFAIKKLSWANLKTTLANLFVSKITTPTVNSLVKVNADGSISNSGVIVDNSGSLLLTSGTGGLGYGTGAGGTVTQLTSKSTAVTLNKPTGRIILNNSALASGAANYFLFSNSNITINDTIKITTVGGTYVTVGSYSVEAEAVGIGFCYIAIKNNTAGSLSEAVQLNFTVIKGAIA